MGDLNITNEERSKINIALESKNGTEEARNIIESKYLKGKEIGKIWQIKIRRQT